MIKPILRVAAWALLCLIAFATLCPIRFRPQLTADPQIERALAFMVTGALFAAAYPRSRTVAALGLLLAVVGLEVGQVFVPGRDGHVHDATAKAIGALAGVALGWVTDWRVWVRMVAAKAAAPGE